MWLVITLGSFIDILLDCDRSMFSLGYFFILFLYLGVLVVLIYYNKNPRKISVETNRHINTVTFVIIILSAILSFGDIGIKYQRQININQIFDLRIILKNNSMDFINTFYKYF